MSSGSTRCAKSVTPWYDGFFYFTLLCVCLNHVHMWVTLVAMSSWSLQCATGLQRPHGTIVPCSFVLLLCVFDSLIVYARACPVKPFICVSFPFPLCTCMHVVNLECVFVRINVHYHLLPFLSHYECVCTLYAESGKHCCCINHKKSILTYSSSRRDMMRCMSAAAPRIPMIQCVHVPLAQFVDWEEPILTPLPCNSLSHT